MKLSNSVWGIFALSVVMSASEAQAHDFARQPAARGAVFTIGNEAARNQVIAFVRNGDGSLIQGDAFDTGGQGSGDSLGSQGALVLTEGAQYLLAVNPGSNDISSFEVQGAKLVLKDRVSAQGTRPISISERAGLVYVLNDGGAGNIAGFWLGRGGRLTPIAGSVRPLSTNAAGPAQLQITSDLRSVIVTEKTANVILSYPIDIRGRARAPHVFASAGMTPFGFDLTADDTLIVSEAATASMSSYALTRAGDLEVISSAVPDTQAAPCWVAISKDNRLAFTANAGSSSISAYAVGRRGDLRLLDAVAGDTGPGSTPLDLSIDRSGAHLYVLGRGVAQVIGFDVERDGQLEQIAAEGQLAPFATGLAAY